MFRATLSRRHEATLRHRARRSIPEARLPSAGRHYVGSLRTPPAGHIPDDDRDAADHRVDRAAFPIRACERAVQDLLSLLLEHTPDLEGRLDDHSFARSAAPGTHERRSREDPFKRARLGSRDDCHSASSHSDLARVTARGSSRGSHLLGDDLDAGVFARPASLVFGAAGDVSPAPKGVKRPARSNDPFKGAYAATVLGRSPRRGTGLPLIRISGSPAATV